MTELEKKAKEYADLFYSYDCETEEVLFKKADIKTAYKQGFEDGFNVDRWHYPSKGEYPKIGEKVFCKDCIGEYNVAEYQGNSVDGEPPWLFNDRIDDYVRAWQYFVPPKEEV